MKHSQTSETSQRGSAHIIILIVLVVALLGALGFIFWQNFMNKAPVATPTTSETKPTTETPAATGFAIEKWGVTIPVEGVVVASQDESFVHLTTQAIIDAAKKAGCPTETQFGYVFRTTDKSQSQPGTPFSALINGYYYGFGFGSQASCVTGSNGDLGDATVNSLMTKEVTALKAAIVDTAVTK